MWINDLFTYPRSWKGRHKGKISPDAEPCLFCSEKQALSKCLLTTRAINRLAREEFDLLGTSDGSALFDFVEEYLCGDDLDNNED